LRLRGKKPRWTRQYLPPGRHIRTRCGSWLFV